MTKSQKTLEKFMKKNNINQAQVADVLGVNKSTVCRWINGECKIPTMVTTYLTVIYSKIS